jgi:hypothetical protein
VLLIFGGIGWSVGYFYRRDVAIFEGWLEDKSDYTTAALG